MINKKEKLKVMSIINICNVPKLNKEDYNYWFLEIKKICKEVLK